MINQDSTNQIMDIAYKTLPRWFVLINQDDILSEGYIAMFKAQQKHDPSISQLNTYAYRHIIWRLRKMFQKHQRNYYAQEIERELRRDSNTIKNTDIHLNIYSNTEDYILKHISMLKNQNKRTIVLEYIRLYSTNIPKTKRVSILCKSLGYSKTYIHNVLNEYKNLYV